jgi:hypothetical protein
MSTTSARRQTHQSVLPQRAALESVPADTVGVTTKRGTDAAKAAPGADHGRGEHRLGVRPPDDRHEGAAQAGPSEPAGSDPGTAQPHVEQPAARHPRVFVLDEHKKPLMPCHPARARELLAKGRARVHRLHPFTIRLTGRTVEGYARTRPDRHGFPRLHLTRQKRHRGFQTGDHVRAVVPTGKKAGTWTGKVAVRSSGSFNITTSAGTVHGISHRYFTLLARADGWAYPHREEEKRHGQFRGSPARLLPALKDGASAASQNG